MCGWMASTPGVRLGHDDRLCSLVMVGARLDGTKELVALADGYRESTESWVEFLRDLKGRGMRAPVLAIGDGALGFWAAIRDVFPETRHQRDWVHKTSNVLDFLPKRVYRRPRRPFTRSAVPRTRRRVPVPSKRLRMSSGRSGQGLSPRSWVRRSSLSPSTSFPPSTGATFAPPTHRVHVRSGEGEDRPDEGTGIEGGGSGDDLQAA